MELEFDNEIDALLRKEVAGRTITISEFSRLHLDADEIAAFAENAVPAGARRAFVEHFAACDMCRKTLSHAITLNAAAEPAATVAAPDETVTESAVPWYRRLFLFPNLAYVMGGLVLLFAGFIGLSVLTGTYRSGQSDLSQVGAERPSTAVSEPEHQNSLANAANSNMQTVVPSIDTAVSSNAAANTMSNAAETDLPSSSSDADERGKNGPAREDEPEMVRNLGDLKANKPQAAAAPPAAKSDAFAKDGVVEQPKMKEKPAAEPATERRKEAKLEEQNVGRATATRAPAKIPGPSNRTNEERNVSRDRVYDSALKKSTQPAPSDSKVESYNRKQVGGRSFEFKQGVWYDTTYRGQGTINVRRHTDQYKKLDSGLRNIAESFFGVVVTVWNGKAYRIQ